MSLNFFLYGSRAYVSLDIKFRAYGSDGTGGRAFCRISSPPEWF